MTTTIPTPEPHRAPPAPRQRSRSAVAALERVTRRYGAVTALDGVDLEIGAGEVVALLGPNGAGKTTAVSLLLGLLRPDAGRVTLFGGPAADPASRLRVGAMLQVSGVPETLQVREHIDLFRSYYPAPLPLAQLIATAGLEGLERRPYGKLSGGQKQRLHLALTLAGDPDLLFLDEPTTGLDVAARRALWEQVRTVIGRGRTVVLTTHYLEEADALADRIVLIDHGRIVADGSPAEIKARTPGRKVRARTRVSADALRALDDVSAVRRDGDVTELLVTRAEPVVLELLRRDPTLTGLEVVGAGLEDAFLALTEGDPS